MRMRTNYFHRKLHEYCRKKRGLRRQAAREAREAEEARSGKSRPAPRPKEPEAPDSPWVIPLLTLILLGSFAAIIGGTVWLLVEVVVWFALPK